MILLGLSRTKGTCPICKSFFEEKDKVYHDNSKSLANSVVHQACWDKLRASRPRTPFTKKSIEVRSAVELDPPF